MLSWIVNPTFWAMNSAKLFLTIQEVILSLLLNYYAPCKSVATSPETGREIGSKVNIWIGTKCQPGLKRL